MMSEQSDSASEDRAEAMTGRESSAARWENEGGETIPATHGVSGEEDAGRSAMRRSVIIDAVFGSAGVSGYSMDDAAAGRALDALRRVRQRMGGAQRGAE